MKLDRRRFLQVGGVVTTSLLIPSAPSDAHTAKRVAKLTPEIAEFLRWWGWQAKFAPIGASTIAKQMHAGFHRGAACWYTRKYFHEHGCVPTGEHRIICTYGEDPACDVHASYVHYEGHMDEIFTFPGEPEVRVSITSVPSAKGP